MSSRVPAVGLQVPVPECTEAAAEELAGHTVEPAAQVAPAAQEQAAVGTAVVPGGGWYWGGGGWDIAAAADTVAADREAAEAASTVEAPAAHTAVARAALA